MPVKTRLASATNLAYSRLRCADRTAHAWQEGPIYPIRGDALSAIGVAQIVKLLATRQALALVDSIHFLGTDL